MKKLLIGIVATLTLLLIAMAVFLRYFDLDRYRDSIETAIYEQSGLTTEIRGGLALSLTPDITLIARQVFISSDGRELAHFDTLSAVADWDPLWRRELQIKQIKLVAPNIRLQQDEAGNLLLPKPPPAEQSSAAPPPLPLQRLVIDNINVENLNLTVQQMGSTEQPELQLDRLNFHLTNLVIAEDQQLLISDWPNYLSRVTLTAQMKIEQLRWRKHRLNQLAIRAANKQQVINATLQALAYQGSAAGAVQMDWREQMTALTGKLEAKGVELADLLQALESTQQATGKLDLLASGNSRAHDSQQWLDSAKAELTLDGQSLNISGFDLDRLADKLTEAQQLNLKDIGGVALAGPLGLMLTKGHSYSGMMQGALAGTTLIKELHGHWQLADKQVLFKDVAAATEANRLAVTGHFEIEGQRFGPLNLYLLDEKGCRRFQQQLAGTLAEPEIGAMNFALGSVVNPLLSLAKSGAAVLDECKRVYSGVVKHPAAGNGITGLIN